MAFVLPAAAAVAVGAPAAIAAFPAVTVAGPLLPVFGAVSTMLMGGVIGGIAAKFFHKRDLLSPGADAAIAQVLFYFENVTQIAEAALLRGMVVEPVLDDLVAAALIPSPPPPPEGKGKREGQLVPPSIFPLPKEGKGDRVVDIRNPHLPAVFRNPEKNFSAMGLISGILNEPVNGIRHGRLAVNLGPEHGNKTAEGKWLLAHPSEASKNQTDGFASLRETLKAWNDLTPEIQRLITHMIAAGAPVVNAAKDTAGTVANDAVLKNATLDTAVKVVLDVADEVLERTKEMNEADADPTLPNIGPLGPIGYIPTLEPVDRMNDLVNKMKSEKAPAPSQ